MLCHDFLWGCHGLCLANPVADTETLGTRVTDAMSRVTKEMLANTWTEVEYRLEVLRVTDGAHVEMH